MLEYPKWLYKYGNEAVIVQNKEEHDALGVGWVESPADIVEVAAEPVRRGRPAKTEE